MGDQALRCHFCYLGDWGGNSGSWVGNGGATGVVTGVATRVATSEVAGG
jgi:hypothetical protein